MGIDFPTALGIAAASFLCVTAAFLAIGGTAQNPDPASVEEMLQLDGDALSEMNARAVAYLEAGEQAKLEGQGAAMRQKLKDVAGYALGVRITTVDAPSFPLENKTESIIGGKSFPVCGAVGDIPAHLYDLREAWLLQAFIEKYSKYPITLFMLDERQARQPWFHYGFSAASGDGKFASIHFHADTCAGEIIDLHGHHLFCRDARLDYSFSSGNPDDTAASMALDEFCVIPISPWRQAFYDYAKEASEETRRHFMGGGPVDDYEAFRAFWHEGERLDALTDLAYAVASDNFADDAIQEKIQEYRDAYGTLPNEFLKLLEDRDDR